MKNKIHFLTIVAAIGLAACAGYQYTSTANMTNVSGQVGFDAVLLSPSGSNFVLRNIEWGERRDRPCQLTAEFIDVSDFSDFSNTVTEQFDRCNGAAGDYLRVFPPTIADDSDRLVINEINTCDSKKDDNRRIKGISIGTSRLNGTREDSSQYECSTSYRGTSVKGRCRDNDVFYSTMSQNNCGDWNTLQSCEAGSVATGLRVHVSDTDEITGLQLQCQAVSVASANP